MSRQSFEAFMSTLRKDGSLQKELREKLGDPAQGVSAEGLNKFAASKGYDFKVEEIKGELSEKQLDAVAGGVVNPLSFSSYYKVESSLLQTQYIKFDYNFQKF